MQKFMVAMALMLLWTGVAEAQQHIASMAVDRCYGRYIELRVRDKAEIFDIAVYAGDLTAVYFFDPIVDVEATKNSDFYLDRKVNLLLLTALPEAKDGARTTTYVTTSTGAHVGLRLSVAAHPGAATTMAVVTLGSKAEKREEALRRAIESALAKAKEEFARRRSELDERERKMAKRERKMQKREQSFDPERIAKEHFAELLLRKYATKTKSGEPVLHGETRRGRRDGGGVVTLVNLDRLDRLDAAGELTAVKFDIDNAGSSPYPLATVRVLDSSRHNDYADLVRLPKFFMAGDGPLIATIPPMTRVSAIVLVKGVPDVTMPLSIQISAPQGLRSVETPAVWELVPVMPEEKHEISLHVQAIGGAIWLGDGIDLEEFDATTMKGLGARATYGFNRWIAIEGELMGASTGDSEFRGVAYDGMQGDLVRSAALGRVQFGGVLRLGKKKIIPTMRLGLGLQGASHDAVFTPAAGAAVEPDVGFELTPFAIFGAGVEARLGQHFLAGVNASVLVPRGNDLFSQSIEAGFHLGYAWTP